MCPASSVQRQTSSARTALAASRSTAATTIERSMLAGLLPAAEGSCPPRAPQAGAIGSPCPVPTRGASTGWRRAPGAERAGKSAVHHHRGGERAREREARGDERHPPERGDERLGDDPLDRDPVGGARLPRSLGAAQLDALGV